MYRRLSEGVILSATASPTCGLGNGRASHGRHPTKRSLIALADAQIIAGAHSVPIFVQDMLNHVAQGAKPSHGLATKLHMASLTLQKFIASTSGGDGMMIGTAPDPDEAGAIAMGVLTCAWCVRDAVDGPPQPYWMGPECRVGGVVLLARNPATKTTYDWSREQPTRDLLARLTAQPGNGASFAEWSTFRIRDVERWTQYGDAYQQVLAGCLRLNQVAWLNVVPFRTPPNRAPSLRQRNHGLEHLIPMLNLLNPAAVVTRYPTPHAVADALSDGRWEVLPLDDRRASHASILAARDRLRALALCTAR